MRRIAGPGHDGNTFVDYDELTNPNGTVYTADYGNDVQDELIGLQEAMGLGEAPGAEHSVAAAVTGMIIRHSHRVGDVVARAGNVVPPAPFSKNNAEAFHPRLCLTDFAGSKVVSEANWPDLVPWLRAQRVVYLEGQAGEAASFAGSVSGSTFTLDGTPVNNDLVTALTEDQLAFGALAAWRSVDIAGVTYEITSIDPASLAITVDGTLPLDASEIAIYPHRVAGSTTTARVHSWRGRSPIGVGTEETISGLMRRDRVEAHTHRITTSLHPTLGYAAAPGGESRYLPPSTSNIGGPVLGLGYWTTRHGVYELDTLQGSGTLPNIGPDTHGPDVGTHLYLHAGRYTV